MGLDMFLYTAPKVEGYTFQEIEEARNLVSFSEGYEAGLKALEERGTASARDIAGELNLVYFHNETNQEFWERVTEFVEDEEHKSRYESYKQLSPEFAALAVSTAGQEEEIGYWRKANHIHNWFVKNVQNGEDDCGEYEVPEEKLKLLRGICEDVLLKSKDNFSASLLPTTSGFFFGGTDYDEYYYADVQETLKIIDQALTQYDLSKTSIVYSSSW